MGDCGPCLCNETVGSGLWEPYANLLEEPNHGDIENCWMLVLACYCFTDRENEDWWQVTVFEFDMRMELYEHHFHIWQRSVWEQDLEGNQNEKKSYLNLSYKCDLLEEFLSCSSTWVTPLMDAERMHTHRGVVAFPGKTIHLHE